MSLRRSSDFRPNPDRAVYLTGIIDQSTLDRLTGPVLRLQAESREPITLFIDSPGGSTYHANIFYKLLSANDQDFSTSCRLITVVTGIAASAASDLLMAGNYALAYPHATLLCHGVRQVKSADMLTREGAVDLAKNLANSNEQFAIQLANNSILRFIFRFVSLRPEFDHIRERQQKSDLPELACFIHALEGRISFPLLDLLRSAWTRSMDNDALDLFASRSLAQQEGLGDLRSAAFEALLLKLIVDYEVEQHKDEAWSFRVSGFESIEEKFVLLIDKHQLRHDDMVRLLCDRWGEFFLAPEESAVLASNPEEQRSEWLFAKVQESLRPIWFFFVSVCRLLQEDDYYLTAEEGYWLGLIDEIIGRSDLPSPRIIVENAPPADGEVATS